MSIPTTLQTNIIARIYTPEELDEFIRRYRASKKGLGFSNREPRLQEPLTDQEKEAVRYYVQDFDVPLSKKAEEMGLKKVTILISLINRGLAKMVYQNQAKIGL